MKTCNNCAKGVKVHVSCFKCHNIYHAKCFLKVPTIYVNEKGHIFCCLNLTSNCNSFEGLENSRHEQEEHEKDKGVCGPRLEKGDNLEEVNKDRVDFVCSFCEVTFFEEKSYGQHTKLCEKEHLWRNKTQDAAIKFKEIYKYKCDKCSYITKFQCLLQRHSTVHSLEKQFKCTFKSCKCTQSPDTSRAKQCDCSKCEYKTSSKDNLQRHILRNHSNKRGMYKCDICMYSASTKNCLTQHVRIHLIEKPFKCDTCEFKTAHKHGLRKHILSKHSNIEKQYKCNHCKFSAHTKSNLKSHMRSLHSDNTKTI